MPDQKQLFPERELTREISDLMGSGEDAPRIAYVGPSVLAARMEATLLADGLKGYARFIDRVAQIHLGPLHEGFRVEVEGEPRSGSLEIVVRFFHPAAEALRAIGDNKVLVGVATISTLTGFTIRDAGKSLIALFRQLRGRPVDSSTDLRTALPKDLPISAAELIRLLNDPEVQAALRAALRPLREPGFEQFETRRGIHTIEVITKADLLAADAAELDELTTDEELLLDVQKVALRSRLAWHFSDGGTPFDAKILDPEFWQRIEAGDRFGLGDKLRVSLHTHAERDDSGHLRVSKTVTKVLAIERRTGEQIDLL